MTAKLTVVLAQAAHEENDATRLSAEEAIVEAAFTVGRLRRLHDEQWRTARSQRRLCTRRNGSRTKSLTTCRRAWRTLTSRSTASLGADGWFRDFRQVMERAIAGSAE